LNWYRGQNIFWQETPFLIGRKLLQPTLYVGGTDDAVVKFAKPYVDNLEKIIPNLWKKVLLPGVGHWTEQEAPTEVNRLMLDFLVSVDGTDAEMARFSQRGKGSKERPIANRPAGWQPAPQSKR
jgi:hypothetical protein